jgi:phosphoglycerate dehydrogenase-like enzyme
MSEDIVLVTSVAFDEHDASTAGRLRSAGLTLRMAPKRGPRPPGELRELLRDVVGAIVSSERFDSALLEECQRLRVIARTGVGFDSIDLEAATRAGIVVTTTPGANEESVADHTLALLLGIVRHLVELNSSVRRGEWKRSSSDLPTELHASTVGIVGFGRIGRAVARRVEAFGATVIVSDPALASSCPLDELLPRVDAVTLHLPLSSETRHLIGTRELALMRSEAILINTSRGGVVDEDALVAALSSGALRGAGLDVFEEEPPVGSALLELPNVLLSPHIAGLSDKAARRMNEAAVRSVLNVLADRRPEGALNWELIRR